MPFTNSKWNRIHKLFYNFSARSLEISIKNVFLVFVVLDNCISINELTSSLSLPLLFFHPFPFCLFLSPRLRSPLELVVCSMEFDGTSCFRWKFSLFLTLMLLPW